MNKRQLQEFWSDWLDQRELSPPEPSHQQEPNRQELGQQERNPQRAIEEQTELLQQMETHEELRLQLLNDLRMDSMLKSHALQIETKASGDSDPFVQEFARRIHQSEQQTIASLSDLDDDAITPPPIVQRATVSKATPSNSAVDATSRSFLTPESERVQNLRRQDSSFNYGVYGIAALILIAVSVGTVAWWPSQPTLTESPTESQSKTTNAQEAPTHELSQQVPPREKNDPITDPSPGNEPGSPFLDEESRPGSIAQTTDSTDPLQLPPSAVETIVEQPPLKPARPLARLTQSNDAVWQGANPGYELMAGKLALREGKAQVIMDDGVEIELIGPVEFELVSLGRTALFRGTISAHVPAAAVGFQVDTPSSQVVDLGTRFTVDVDDKGATGVRVQQGLVEMTAASDPDSDPASPKSLPAKKTWRLGEGNFKWISADRKSNLDWRLVLSVDNGTFSGSMNLNGVSDDFSDRTSFIKAFRNITREMSAVQKQILKSTRSETDFHAELNINGHSITMKDAKEASDARRFAVEQLQTILREGLKRPDGFKLPIDMFEGVININGEEIRIGNLDEFMKKQEELMKEFNDKLK